MTVKFSPGPWSINKTRKYDGNYGRKSGAIIDANGEPIVLFDPSDGEYFPALDEDSPDANLIAAAPDLLDALSKLTDMYCRLVNSGDCGNWNPEDDIEVKEAREAIAKATGKSL